MQARASKTVRAWKRHGFEISLYDPPGCEWTPDGRRKVGIRFRDRLLLLNTQHVLPLGVQIGDPEAIASVLIAVLDELDPQRGNYDPATLTDEQVAWAAGLRPFVARREQLVEIATEIAAMCTSVAAAKSRQELPEWACRRWSGWNVLHGYADCDNCLDAVEIHRRAAS